MTLVYQDPTVAGAGTHLLIVGVGAYPYLPGGDGGRITRFHDNMRQLSSPPESARAVARWFIEHFEHPDRPLASVALLLSGGTDVFSRPVRAVGAVDNGVPPTGDRQVGVADLAGIKTAARAWRRRGNDHPSSLMLFYFCGHGMMAGTELSLVARDFGEDDDNPMDGLIDFGGFLAGMGECQSKDQCFFIDACRVASGKILPTANSTGDPLVQTTGMLPGGLKRSIYYSTLGGSKAHGLKGQPSLYTATLLRAMEGPGASNTGDGRWLVTTTRLSEALSHFMLRLVDPDLPVVQIPETGAQVLFDLHRLPGKPKVPLTIPMPPHRGTKPPPELSAVEIKRHQDVVAGWSSPRKAYPSNCEWRKRHFETWLTVGDYEAQVSRRDGTSSRAECTLGTPGLNLTDI